MRKTILIVCLFLSCSPVHGDEWPVYFPAVVSDPVTPTPDHLTPTPTGTPGNGVLDRNRIAPNEKIITVATLPEQWTIEFLEDGRFKLTSDRTGDEGTFLNTNKSRSKSGRLVLVPKPPATPGTPVIVENTPRPGDKFIFTVEQPAQKNENFMILFGDYNENPGVHYWHGALDIRVPGSAWIPSSASIYPVRNGEVVDINMDDDQIAVEVAGSPGIYDIYAHVYDIEVSKGDDVVASGENATRIASQVVHHRIPHLHFEVSDWYENKPTPPTPKAKAIRNPLNGIVPFTDTSQPETIEIHFRVDDYTPTPVYRTDEMFEIKEEERSGIFEFISGKMDVIARVSDDNDVNDIGPPEQSCGIHQIQYKIYDGFDLSGIILQEGILFNDTTFRGEHPSFDDEYTPYFFDIYTGCHTVPWSDVLDEYNTRNFEYHYIVTNNTDPSGAKSGLGKRGCWDTEESISVPPPAATPTAKFFPDGPYTVLIQSADIAGNWSDDDDDANRKTITVKNEYERVFYVEAGYTPLPAPTPRGSIDNPYGTINEAIKTPTPGYKTLIYLKPGTYQTGETFPIQIPGNFTISGTDQSNTIVAGSGSGPVIKFSENNSGLSNLTVLYGGSAEEAQVVVEGYDATIENCRIDGNGAAAPSGIYLHMNWNPKVNNCLILNHSENGILMNDVRYPDISNCVFQNNNIGVNANHEATCVLILNSIFDNNTQRAVRANSISYVSVGYCCMHNSGNPWYEVDNMNHFVQEGVLTTDPLFEPGSYYLQTSPISSPCINLGSHSGWMQYGSYTNSWNINAQIFLRTTRKDNQPFQSGLYDENWVDAGFHYKPVYTPTPSPTASTTPVDTPTPTPSNTPSHTPTPTNTYHPGTGYVTFDFSNYYTTGATAEIMLVDADLNTDPMIAESYDVDVTSQTDSSGIPMTVTEINMDSNIFTTSSSSNDLGFTSGSSVPYSMIQVSDGDWVEVTYNDSSPPGTIIDTSWWYGSYPPPTNTPLPTDTPTATPTSTTTPLSGEYFEDFESGADGWTITGLWHLTSANSYSPSHSMWYGQEITGDYNTGAANSGAIISPRILLTEDFHLAYYSREETEGTGDVFDTRKVFVSNDNGDSWTLIHQSRNNGNSWFYAGVYDLSPYTGEVVRIKFEFDTEDEVSNDHSGWFVDDIIVGHPPLPIPSMGLAGLGILAGFFIILLRKRK